MRDDDGKASEVVTIIADDTRLAQLNHQVLHDAVTGLPNHECFAARLSQTLRTGKPITLYELELDGFPLLSNGLGRQTGERLLHAAGERLRDMLADTVDATLARLDGATFAILAGTTPDTGTMIGRIRQAFAEPIQVGDLRVPASVSIGVVHQRSCHTDPADLIHAADLALRRAKRKGPGQWALSDPKWDGRDRETLALAATMPQAWASGQLRVGWRPAVRLADNRVVGIEALAVWHHPSYGLITHQRCQELAERSGLITQLGDWLLRRACERVQRRSDLPVHAGLTGSQATDRDLVVRVRQVLEDTGLPRARLRIGVPMAELRSDRGGAENVRGLAEAGVRVAARHVGGTPEDVAYLHELDVRVAHLSPSLIQHQADHPTPLMTTAVNGLITLLHQIDATVIVDNLTRRTQADWWRTIGADTATGPLFDHRR